jgi:hypothetical protein
MPTQLKSLEKPKESTQTRETNPKYKELNKSQCQVMDAAKKESKPYILPIFYKTISNLFIGFL